MSTYRVTLAKTIWCVIEVEAADEDAAIQEAFAEAPTSICAQCGGWGQRWSVDDDMEWMTLDEFHDDYDPEQHGLTVEPAAAPSTPEATP